MGTRRSDLNRLEAARVEGMVGRCSWDLWHPGTQSKAQTEEAVEEGRASTRWAFGPGGSLQEMAEDSLWEAGEDTQGSQQVVGCIEEEEGHRDSRREDRRVVPGRHQVAVEDTRHQGRPVEGRIAVAGGSRREPGLVGSNRTWFLCAC